MKKIDLITGFLGSGKTTFLKEYVKYLISIGEKVCILENDFGAVNVDMMLLNSLRGENCELEMVAGGCDMDCHRRRFKTKLIAMGMEDYTRIVIEPSGIFDVDEFFDCLYDEPLCNWYEIGNVISIVDAKMDTTLSDSSRAIFAGEIACAGLIVLSKTQLYSEEDIICTKQYVKESLKTVGCNRDDNLCFFEKDWSQITTDDFLAIANSGYKKESYSKAMANYDVFSTVCFLDEKLSVEEIKALADIILADFSFGNVFRIKGFCLENGEWTEINVNKYNSNIAKLDEGQDVLIVIGENIDEGKIREELKKLRKPSKM